MHPRAPNFQNFMGGGGGGGGGVGHARRSPYRGPHAVAHCRRRGARTGINLLLLPKIQDKNLPFLKILR